MTAAEKLLEFQNVVFYYESSRTPVVDGLSVRLAPGWTGVIGPNGVGKTTILRLACRELQPTRGLIRSPESGVYCSQRTDGPSDDAGAFMDAQDGLARGLCGRLGIASDWLIRWSTLSHGERRRMQIAIALWRRPRLLAVDEPTNHIDLGARRLLKDALHSFKGIGLLVSHDRELLDDICAQCLVVGPPTPVLRPGGYTEATRQSEAEQAEARQARAQAQRELKLIKQKATIRQEEAARSHRRLSRRGLATKDHDAKARRGMARLTGKDARAGNAASQSEGRLERARRKLEDINVPRQRKLGLQLRGEQSRRNALFCLPAGSLELGGRRSLTIPELAMDVWDRIALTGRNGVGKSTLIRHIVMGLKLPADRVVYLPQEIDRFKARQILAAVRQMPRAELGQVLAAVDNLGTPPTRVLETEEPSPGEVRKIVLAMGLAKSPHLIVMDEPTNHLDLPSIECLERAVAACPAALLLVSHDLHFRQRLTRTRWEITEELSLVIRQGGS